MVEQTKYLRITDLDKKTKSELREIYIGVINDAEILLL